MFYPILTSVGCGGREPECVGWWLASKIQHHKDDAVEKPKKKLREIPPEFKPLLRTVGEEIYVERKLEKFNWSNLKLRVVIGSQDLDETCIEWS